MSKITQRMNEIKNDYQEYSKADAVEKASYFASRNRDFAKLADAFAWKVYRVLKIEVQTCCGLEDVVEIIAADCELKRVLEDDADVVKRLFHDQTGLTVLSFEGYSDKVKLRLPDEANMLAEAKVLTMMHADKVETLNFAELLRENIRRRKVWKKNLTAVAKLAIDKCREALESMPGKHFGIPEVFPIRLFRDGDYSSVPFVGEVDIGGVSVKYQNLTNAQVTELCREMNTMIAHGRVTFEERIGDFIDLRPTIFWEPMKRATDKTYFDYAEFYTRYDGVTPELEKMFRTIVTGAKFPEAAGQIATLEPQRKIVYHLMEGDGIVFEFLNRLKITTQRPYLMNMVNEQFPSLVVTKMEFKRDKELFRNDVSKISDERIEMAVEVSDTVTDEMSSRQRRIEQVIRYFKEHKAQYFANVIAGRVLDDICSTKGCRVYFDIFADSAKWWKWSREHFIVPLKGRVIKQLATELDCSVGDFKVDLTRVEDKRFLCRIQTEIARSTDGLIEADIVNWEYKLCLGETNE